MCLFYQFLSGYINCSSDVPSDPTSLRPRGSRTDSRVIRREQLRADWSMEDCDHFLLFDMFISKLQDWTWYKWSIEFQYDSWCMIVDVPISKAIEEQLSITYFDLA